jgi:hypothetical protein
LHRLLYDSIAVQIAASPMPMQGLEAFRKASGVNDVFHQHVRVIKDAKDTMEILKDHKLQEYHHESKSLKKGLPISRYSNKHYDEAVKQVDSHKQALDMQFKKVNDHIVALANHKNPKDVKEMIKEASKMHSAYKTFIPIYKHHVEDIDAHKDIRHFVNIREKHSGRIPQKSDSNVHEKAKKIQDIYHALPIYSTTGL